MPLILFGNPSHFFEFLHALMFVALDVSQITLTASLCGRFARGLLKMVDLTVLVRLQRIARRAYVEDAARGWADVVAI